MTLDREHLEYPQRSYGMDHDRYCDQRAADEDQFQQFLIPSGRKDAAMLMGIPGLWILLSERDTF